MLFILLSDCHQAPGALAELSCASDMLTETWPTSTIFDGTVTQIPENLNQSLTSRLIEESKYNSLDLMVPSLNPP